MNKTTKICLIIAAALAVLGLILFAGAMAAFDFDFNKLGNVGYENNTYEVTEVFDRISIDVDTTEIEFQPSDDEECRIVCFETQKIKHSAVVQDGTLIISAVDSRKWYEHIGIFLGTQKMTVYLPQSEYTSLLIDTGTGDIGIPGDFVFGNVDISGSTADVECQASVLNGMRIKLSTGTIRLKDAAAAELDLCVTTGNIAVNSVVCSGSIKVGVSTGRTELTDVRCKTVTSNGDTGRITLTNVTASELISVERSTGGVTLERSEAERIVIETSTGTVRFENSDAGEIYVKTTTGSVKGTLLTEKIFITETDTGRVNVPKTTSGGRCEIITDTGNIEIDIQ